MKLKTCLILHVLLMLFFMLFSCNQPKGQSGQIGDWVKLKALSVKVNTNSLLEVQNDSDKDASIAPLKIVGWYTKSGKGELMLDEKQLNPNTLPPHMKFFLTINDMLMVSTDDSQFKTQASLLDIELERVNISIGNELFYITFRHISFAELGQQAVLRFS